ncbi:DNA-(apurinic or apyrimidinic site) lyase [Colletotrichum musicola]|uniref:Apurinic-apyrimidinic endonuclease 1 n=1 Tax=Colletotrichum musicola TaxID=2175873 RepID=A0A8H6JGT4_9PEZI|nr:DNA-(apurinic or apyrimidinic site) lyase [Colletotrichum musicola]
MPPRASARIKAQAVVETKVEAKTTAKADGAKSTTTVAATTKAKVAKPAAKTAAKTAAKPTEKPVAKSAAKPAPKRALETDDEKECGSCAEDEEEEKPAKKRKTAAKSKAKKEDNMEPVARTAVSSLKKAMYIGAHVSGAGGVHNSIQNALDIGANAFALFLKSQRKWESPPMAPDVKKQFLTLAERHGYDAGAHVLPHGSYLVNLAQADAGKAAQAYGSFVDDLRRCEQLGVRLYNFHPGNTGGAARGEACGRIAERLNAAHRETEGVVTVLENMAGAGNVVGTRFEDLRDIIDKVEDKERVGVCIDTCHAFAAGYDLRTPEKFAETMKEFDEVVGNKYLKAFHLNDSKAPFASHRDLHANIGTGFLGLRAFHSLVNDETFRGMPMVLETPIDRRDEASGKTTEDRRVWAEEIKLLERLIGMDAESDEFKELEADLQERGAAERSKFQDQADRKAAKDAKKGTRGGKKAAGKGRKKKVETTDDEESE